MTDKIEYDNDFQSRLPCWDLKRERFLIHYWFPENHILQGIRIVSFVSYSNFLISNNSFLLTIGQRSSKAVPVQWDFCNKATGSRVLLRGNPKPTGYPISHHRNSSAHVSRIDVGIQLCKLSNSGSLPNQNITWLYNYLRSFKAEKNLRQTFLKFTLLEPVQYPWRTAQSWPWHIHHSALVMALDWMFFQESEIKMNQN